MSMEKDSTGAISERVAYRIYLKLRYRESHESYIILTKLEITVKRERDSKIEAEVRAIAEDGKVFSVQFNRLRINSTVLSSVAEPKEEEGQVEGFQLKVIDLLNLAIYLAESGKPRYVYFNMSGEMRITQSQIQVDSLEMVDNLSITRTRIFFKHEDSMRGLRKHEYTICNNTDFPVKHIYFKLDSYVRGLRVEENRESLILLTNGQLRELLGEDVNRVEFTVVAELERELNPGECRIISFKGYDEIRRDQKGFEIKIQLFGNITEGIVIIPPRGYKVISNLGKISFTRLEEERPEEKTVSLDNWNKRKVELFPGVKLDLFGNPEPVNGVIESNSAIDMQFRTEIDSKGTQVNVKVTYNLEFQYLSFWRSFLWLMNMLLWGLFLQEFVVHLGETFKLLGIPGFEISSFGFSLAFLLGLVVGLLSFPYYIQANIGYVGKAIRSLLGRLSRRQPEAISLLVIMIMTIVGLLGEFGSIKGNPLSYVSFAYLEIEFAIVVVLELAFVLVERELREEYRNVLLVLVILSVISMLLAVP